jgi:hypothetical protein
MLNKLHSRVETKKYESKAADHKDAGNTSAISSKSMVIEEGNFMSIVRKSVAQGASVGLAKGPRDDLLL